MLIRCDPLFCDPSLCVIPRSAATRDLHFLPYAVILRNEVTKDLLFLCEICVICGLFSVSSF